MSGAPLGDSGRALALALRTRLVGLSVLRTELGLRDALRVGILVEKGPDPFAELGEAADGSETQSRAQIAPAVRLYRALRERRGPEEALRVSARVVREASILFLQHSVGTLNLADWRARDDDARRRWVEGIQARFFNAEADIERVRERGFVMRVRRCHFVRLCREAGCPELTPVFCAGDMAFFNRGPLQLERPGTLAEGAPACEFQFSIRETP